ncbi:hypothetical protein L2E82_05574 [Cichorium intybus]|uniref:Uncharacterized protein n=1 Tax=Cichorium intybus TaxID=13427 RepID=A0ACB9H8F3_CICIN|nr:hypothetical protein L2E82_05574 [Cichorium intybus]
MSQPPMSQPPPQPPMSQPPVSPDIVQETQEEDDNQTRRAARRKAKQTGGEKRTNWTKDEELNLVKACISASVDPIVGDSKTLDTFWNKVQAFFYEFMGEKNATWIKLRGNFGRCD